MRERSSFIALAAGLMACAALAGCTVPADSIATNSANTIVADDEALCRYSEAAGGSTSYAQCRRKLESQRTRVRTAGATRVEGYALLQGPAVSAPTGLAGDCKAGKTGTTCPADDTTGSIPAQPKH